MWRERERKRGGGEEERERDIYVDKDMGTAINWRQKTKY
jgi:hypothetical protein